MKSICTLVASILTCLLSASGVRAQSAETPLKAADQLKITITGVPPNDQQSMALQVYTVSNDGAITIQHIGQVRALGLTCSQLARAIESTYKAAKIYTKPAINVSRINDITTSQTVTVSGRVKLGGPAILRSGMRIIDAIADKGGPDDFGNMSKVRLIRGQKVQYLDLKDISKHPENNVVLEPGDLIIIPGTGFFN